MEVGQHFDHFRLFNAQNTEGISTETRLLENDKTENHHRITHETIGRIRNVLSAWEWTCGWSSPRGGQRCRGSAGINWSCRDGDYDDVRADDGDGDATGGGSRHRRSRTIRISYGIRRDNCEESDRRLMIIGRERYYWIQSIADLVVCCSTSGYVLKGHSTEFHTVLKYYVDCSKHTSIHIEFFFLRLLIV